VSGTEVLISAAVEGIVDQAVVQRLIDEAGLSIYSVYGFKGKSFLKQRIAAFNNAGRFNPWLVLVDLDNCDCAPRLRLKWLADCSRFRRFRIAVRSVESWLMADPDTLSAFLHVRRTSVPVHPDALENPKLSLVNLARHSTRTDIRKDMVPRPTSSSKVGPAYASRLIEYVSDRDCGWRHAQAASASESLRRCRASLRTLTTA
jgi:hypothetical protein